MNTNQEKVNPPDSFIGSHGQTPEITTARLATTLQSVGDGVILTDLQGRVEFLNRTAEHLIGIESAAAGGLFLNEVLRLEERHGRAVNGNLVELAIVSEAPVALGKDLVLNPHTGAPREVEGEICVCNGGGSVTGAVVTFRDVTARKWDELQRREEQKMRAIGQLAGAVAHDLNSSLTIIAGHSEAIEELYSELEPLQASTVEIRRAASEIATVARQLLALSRRAVLFPKAVNPSTLLQQSRQKLTDQLPPSIELVMKLETNVGAVLVDPKQLEQVILDLLEYCCDRMPTGGKIEVATSNVILDRNYRARHSKSFVELTVTDEGPSLAGLALERIFEPAWTRGQGRASGLSLFSIQNVVNAAEGHLSVKNEKESGIKFTLLLPQMDEVVPVSVAAAAPVIQMENQSTILLVEDDDGIRILLRNSLKKRGYRVIEARDGAEGILQAELYEGSINLLITDVVMPVMDGPALAENLAKTRPGIKLLLISGCPEDLVYTQQLVNRGAHFVQKPFSQRELVTLVETILSDNKSALIEP
jgi:hypothetical protein